MDLVGMGDMGDMGDGDRWTGWSMGGQEVDTATGDPDRTCFIFPGNI